MTALGAALKASATVTDLNISKNDLKAKDITGFAEHLKDMGSLSKLIFSGDLRNSTPVTMEVGMTEADFSGANLGVSGAIIVSAFIPKW
jgi:hypothetical protein